MFNFNFDYYWSITVIHIIIIIILHLIFVLVSIQKNCFNFVSPKNYCDTFLFCFRWWMNELTPFWCWFCTCIFNTLSVCVFICVYFVHFWKWTEKITQFFFFQMKNFEKNKWMNEMVAPIHMMTILENDDLLLIKINFILKL